VVAEQVFGAIRDERFWILPHPETKPGVQARMKTILDEQNPVFQPFFD
jgi:hypothetical protein